MPILDDLSSVSQQISLTGNVTRVESLLWKRDELDLIILNKVGEANGVEMNELVKNLPLAYSALATRVRKLHELELLKRSKRIGERSSTRPPYVYYLGTDLTLEAVTVVIYRKGINVRQFQVNQEHKRAATTEDAVNSDSSNTEVEQLDPWAEPVETDFDTNTNNDTYSFSEAVNTAEPSKPDVFEISEIKSLDVDPSSTTSNNLNSDVDFWQLLTRMAQDIVDLKKENVDFKEEVLNLKSRLTKLEQEPQSVKENNANKIWNILEQTPNGKVTN